MTFRVAPPLWKAIAIYYAIVCLAFAVIGMVGADGAPSGALVGLGIVAASHFVPFVRPPEIDPKLFLLLMLAALAFAYLVLRMLSGWARIGAVIALLMAWLGWGFAVLAISA